jgi:cation diffusion facilitator family transporter
LDQNKIKMRAAIFSLIVGLILFAAKISAFILTDSSAIFSDAAESVVHILATGVLVFSIYLSNKPPDKSHFYGHGNIEYFSAGFEGLLIIIAAITIIYTAVIDIVIGADPKNLNTGTLIIGAAGVINIFVGFYLIKQGKKTNSVALIADGKHVLTDSVTSIGVIFGLIMIMITGISLFDPIVAILVAVNIVYTGYKLIRSSFAELMNETDPELLKLIHNKLSAIKKIYWIDLHHLRFWKSADRVFIDFHLTLPYFFTIKQTHLEEEYLCKELTELMKGCDLRLHIDYCDESLCKYCNFDTCEVRTESKKSEIEWTVEKILGDPINKKSHIS